MMSVAVDERELVTSATARDPEALSRLFETFSPKLFRYGLLNLGDAAEAEDFAADVMVSVLVAVERYRFSGAPLSAWVFRIARNKLIDMSRRKKRGGTCALRWDPVAEGGTYDRVERHLAGKAIRKAVEGLPDDQRDVILLRYFADCDTATTARLLGRTEASVKSLRVRALRSLRRIVNIQLRSDD
jgi:RNA polymerase sigma-70 factor (ECF subfamily)